VKRVDVRSIEKRLRSEKPDAMEAPAWVRTRVVASMDEDQSAVAGRTRASRLFGLSLGTGALAAVALGAVIWMMPAQQAVPDESWDSPGGAVKISLPVAIRVPGPMTLEREAENLREDVVDLLGVIRVPAEKLSQASKQFKGSV